MPTNTVSRNLRAGAAALALSFAAAVYAAPMAQAGCPIFGGPNASPYGIKVLPWCKGSSEQGVRAQSSDLRAADPQLAKAPSYARQVPEVSGTPARVRRPIFAGPNASPYGTKVLPWLHDTQE